MVRSQKFRLTPESTPAGFCAFFGPGAGVKFRIFANLGIDLEGFRSRLGLEGFRSRDFEYCKKTGY